jgi:uncharacterized membrane protein YesL
VTAAGRLNVSADSWEMLWSFLHRVLVLNLGLALAGLPLIGGLALVARPWDYPVFFAALACCLGPALAAAFGYLAAAEDNDRAGIAEFARAYRRHALPAATRWAVTTALLGVLVTDIVLLHDSPAGAALVPMLAVLAVLVLSAGLISLAMLSLRPEPRLWRSLATAAVVALRRWPLTLLSLAVLGAAAVVVNQAPLLGLATVPGCAVVLAWANSRISVSPRPPKSLQPPRSPQANPIAR